MKNLSYDTRSPGQYLNGEPSRISCRSSTQSIAMFCEFLKHAQFEVLTAVTVEITVFWNVTPYSLVDWY
jgi:hypothetical protein